MAAQNVPDSRTYRHMKCDEETVVAEESFSALSNPMSGIDKTMCSICAAMFPVSEFEWSDTNEKISDYYARHSKDATERERFLCSKNFMMIVILLCVITTAFGFYYLVKDEDTMVQGICVFTGLVVGAVIGANVFERIFEKPITKKVCGVSDTRVLE